MPESYDFRRAYSYDFRKEAREFGSPEALKEYLRAHPKADPRNHSVSKNDSNSGKSDSVPTKELSEALEDAGSVKNYMGRPMRDSPYVKALRDKVKGGKPVSKDVLDKAMNTVDTYIDMDTTSSKDKARLHKFKQVMKEYSSK